MLPVKLPSAFILTADSYLPPWTWMFLDPGMFKHGYLHLAMGVLHFQCVLSLFPVVWCRGLEWVGRDLGSDLDSAAPESWSKSLNFCGAQFFSCQLGTITSVLSPWKPFGKCSVVQIEGGLLWGKAYHRCSIVDTSLTMWRGFATMWRQYSSYNVKGEKKQKIKLLNVQYDLNYVKYKQERD